MVYPTLFAIVCERLDVNWLSICLRSCQNCLYIISSHAQDKVVT